MDIRASRSAIATQATRSQETRAIRNRITIKIAPTVSRSGGTAVKRPPRVLYVAGDSMHTQLIGMVLANHDMTVSAVTHAGASTVSLSVQVPDVILLDSDTDGVDGEAVLRGLRANPEMRRVPVILLTNRAMSEGMCRELAGYGVHWILEKPIVPLSLPNLIERTIQNASRGGEGAAAPQFQRSALLIECGQTASGAAWKAVW